MIRKGLSEGDRVRALAQDNMMLSPNRGRSAGPKNGGEVFANRGFSERLIDALLAADIDAPERLLFMNEAALRKIPGVGPKSLAELVAYRDRFLPPRVSAGGAATGKHATDHPKPVGPATEVVKAMDEAISGDRARRKGSGVHGVRLRKPKA